MANAASGWSTPHGKMLHSAGTAEAANVSRFRPMPPKPLAGRKPAYQVGGPSLKTWGRFGLLEG